MEPYIMYATIAAGFIAFGLLIRTLMTSPKKNTKLKSRREEV